MSKSTILSHEAS